VLTIEIAVKLHGEEIHKQTVLVPSNEQEAKLSARSGVEGNRGPKACSLCGKEKDDAQFKFASNSGKRSKSCLNCRTDNRTALLSKGAIAGHVTRQLGPAPEPAHTEEWTTVRDIADGVLKGKQIDDPSLAGFKVTQLRPGQ
jgi:hypothetical protein